MNLKDRIEDTAEPFAIPTPGNGQDTDIQELTRSYDTMFERRIETNPQALTMGFWEEHFAKRTVCESVEIRGRVLDIGCGTGEIDIWLARLKNDVHITALDISPMGLKLAAKNISAEPGTIRDRISFVRSIAEYLPYPDHTFDSCFTSHTMEHIRDHGPIFRELSRVLKPEAFVIVVVPFKSFHDDPTHVWHFDEDELKEHLSLYGDEVEVWKSPDGQQLAARLKPLKRKRVIGMLRIKNEEKWIAKVLEKASPIVDGFVILDDGSTDRTPDICAAFSTVFRYERQQEDSVDEARDKNKLLNLALQYGPDWILALDGDEVLEDSASSAIARLLSSVPPDVTVISVDFLYMWNSDEEYRVDGKYFGINHPRLFKVSGLGIPSGTLAFKSTQHGSNFHCGSVPSNMPGKIFQTDIKVKHYGYFEREQRENKKSFYVAHDPDQAAQGYYDHLTDETGIELLKWNERMLEEVRCLKGLVQGAAESEETRRRFDRLPQYYKHLRQEILGAVPATAVRILDVGCGAGTLGKALKAQRPGRTVTGIELDVDAFCFANRQLDRAFNVDVESFAPPFVKGEFDCIIFADILEHLRNPWEVVRKYAGFLKEGATVIVSIPNIRYLGILRDLAEQGKWEYQDEGILDRTHLRFFTRREFTKLLSQAGITCESVSYIGTTEMQPYRPQEPDRSVRFGNLEIHNVSDETFDELSAYQILFIGKYKPGPTGGAIMETRDVTEDLYAEAQAAIGRRDFISASNILEKLLRSIPDHPSVLNDLAVAKAQLGKTEEALSLLKRVIVVDPENQIAAQNIELLSQKVDRAPAAGFSQTGNGPTISVAAEIERAEEEIQKHKFEEASALLGMILSSFPNNTDALNDLAVVRILTGNLSDALRLIKQVLEIDPRNKIAADNLKLVENAIGEQQAAADLTAGAEESSGRGLKVSSVYEEISCPFCGSKNAASFRKAADIVKCGSCGTVYLRTRLTEEGMVAVYQRYADEGSHLSLPKSEAEMRASALRRDYFLDEIISLTKDRGVFLDVGCAWGAFLDNARARGFKTRGIEITRLTADFAANTLGLDVTSEQFLDTPFDKKSVSVLSMIHVLEHLPHPKEAMAKAFDILQSGGIFAGIVPNIESLSSAVQQDGWEWLQPLYHYVHYSPSTLKRHLEDAGFQIERMYTVSGDCNRKSLEEVIRRTFSPKTDRDFDDVLRAVENGGYGEEIRFLARKPESSLTGDRLGQNSHPAQSIELSQVETIVSDKMGALLGKRSLDELELDRLYNESQESIAAGNIDEAMGLLNRILASAPGNPQAINDLAVLHSVRGNIDEAIELLNRLVHSNTADAIVRKNLGSLYLRKNRIEDALRSYYAALEISPNDTEVLLALASICVAIEREDDAAILFDRVLTLDPQNSTAASGAAALARKLLPPEGDLQETKTPSIFSPTSGSPLVSIIIPVYNKWEFTEKCLESIAKAVRYPNYEVLVVDNASTDGTQESMKILSSEDRRVIYIRNESNLGFVDACNLGADRARGEYVLLLNNDTVVNDGWLESLVAFAEKTPDCGAVGSRLVYPDGRLQEAGGITFSDANGWNYGRGMNPNHPKFTFVREVDYISGASLMVRKSLWEKIGGLDRRYAPAYYEDADLCFAIRKLGYRVYYEPKSSLVHFEGATSGTNLQQGFKKYQLLNRPKFAEKWKKELASQRQNDPRNVEVASSRGITGRILVVDPILPMFDRAAGSLHLFNILKVLRSLNFSITFIATNQGLFNRYKPILEEMGIETYAGDQEAMKYFGHNLVYPRVDYASLFKEREFDFALIDFWYQAEYYLPLIRKYSPHTRIIIDTEDVHFVREIREAELKEDTELKARALEKKKREIEVYGMADSVWVVTEQDRQALLDAGVITPIDIRPVIHDVPEVKNNYAAREGILFVGNFNHTPNIDAVRFFVTEVLPEVHKSLPEVVLDIVGNDPTNLTGPLASDRIRPIGYVQDISKYYEKCRLVVAPLRYGAGLKGKIVEALSYGVPVVTTSIGVEGMKLRDGQDIFVADDPAVMAAKIVDAYSRPDIWERLSTNGRSAMVSTWSFDAGRKRIEEILKPLKSSPRIPGAKFTSIVILTYNQLEYTKITIDSVRKHTRKPYEIIVIDNASSDGTVEYLKSQKDIRTIFNEENLGFPAGCNQGMEIAKGDYVVLLNNDVIVSDNWLEGLVECAESSPQIGIVGPMSNRISGYQLETNVSYRKLSQVPDFAAKYRRKNRKRWSESPRVAGFCMLIKRDLLDKIGGLDVAFGIGNCEDDDYCLRARLAGYKVAIAGDVFIHHFGSKSFGKDGLEKYKEFIRANEVIFRAKWGISPLEYWREGKNPTKTSGLSLPLAVREPIPVEVL